MPALALLALAPTAALGLAGLAPAALNLSGGAGNASAVGLAALAGLAVHGADLGGVGAGHAGYSTTPAAAVAFAEQDCGEDGAGGDCDDDDNPIKYPAVQAFFCILYTTIFVLGVFGNVLVCYVVGRNRAMQTVTNFFITNLALSDILLCVLAVPFTPLYSFVGHWVFGRLMCHLVTYAQGTSVYISTLTLTSIAIDRYFVIIYPFQPRMKQSTCVWIILGIWVFSLVVTLPYGLYMSYNTYASEDNSTTTQYGGAAFGAEDNSTTQYNSYCEEAWPTESFRQFYSGVTTVLQFLVPLVMIAFCYIRVSVRLSDHARLKPGCKSSRKEEADRERKRRTNRMLIAMVTVFGMSWMPLNVINLVNDIHMTIGNWRYYNLVFFMVHALAMSSTCYNPFLYAWLNDNFRKEFKQVLPCFIRFGLSQPGCSSGPATTQTTAALAPLASPWRPGAAAGGPCHGPCSEAAACNGGSAGAPPRTASGRASARAGRGREAHDALLPAGSKSAAKTGPPSRQRPGRCEDEATARAPPPPGPGAPGAQIVQHQLRGKRTDPSASSPVTEAVSWTGGASCASLGQLGDLITATYSTEDGSVEVHLPLEVVGLRDVGDLGDGHAPSSPPPASGCSRGPAVAPPERPLVSISPEGSPSASPISPRSSGCGNGGLGLPAPQPGPDMDPLHLHATTTASMAGAVGQGTTMA